MVSAPLLLLPLMAACAGGSQVVCRRDPITGGEQCGPTSNNYGEAAVGAGAAATTWAVVGCTVNGCPAPDRCNETTKQCEATLCHSDKECGAGFHCDIVSTRCR
ncbi:MAG TPA: hypothetical protein VHM19_16975 [Polyangiales bacterium]|nr:hypothetical protein [Polyangiales bacterium]